MQPLLLLLGVKRLAVLAEWEINMANELNQFNLSQAGTMSPEDYAQQQQLNRQQQMAAMLMQQNQQPQGQMVSGRYVPTSFFQNLQPVANMLTGAYLAKQGDVEANKLAQKLRTQEISDIEKYNQLLKGTPGSSVQPTLAGKPMRDDETGALYPPIVNAATLGNPDAANLFAASSYSPILRQMGLKRMTEGPKWEKAEMPMADGSVRHGWVNYNSPNPRDTFIEGGTKPAYNALEGAKFQYETGMQPPNAVVQSATNRPVQPSMPTQTAPVQPGQAPVAVAPMTNRATAAPMSNQVSNQPITATGNAVPVSAMNRPGMSPKDLSEANKAIYTKSEEQRQADLKALPGNIEQANMAIKTIDQMIGDARLNDKGEVVYQKYDPVSKKYVEGVKPHGGFENYVGATMFPGLRFIEGTDTASFDPLYQSIKGQAFLDAFTRLKGGGQITEIEGQKATDALLKLNKAQTEKDFIKYAREFQENLQRGMELAKNKAGVSKEYRSPVNQPALRWNPQTNSWVNQ
jgi:hypothetical protein